MVDIGDRPRGNLKELAAVSGDLPVFDSDLRDTLQWAAAHYVAPVSVMLEKAAPPSLPRGSATPAFAKLETSEDRGGPFAGIARSAAAQKRRPITALVGRWEPDEWLGALGPVLAADGSVMVVVATAMEADSLGDRSRSWYGKRVVDVRGHSSKELTRAWADAQAAGSLVIGTPRVAAWSLPRLRLALVMEESRRAMKDRQTPTLHVRELMSHRHRAEGFGLAFVGPTPSIEVLASGPEVIRRHGRAWPLVEVVDRSKEAPGSGFISDQVVAALRAVVKEGGQAFVFTHLRLADASVRCVTCRRVRRCEQCGSRLGTAGSCPRCGHVAEGCSSCRGATFEKMGTEPERLAAEINRRLGEETAGVIPTQLPIGVGTERDLVDLGPQTLVVAADADGLALGHDYRAAEEALRVLARLANKLGHGSGRRMMVQTSMVSSTLISTLRKGDSMPYLERLLIERARDGLPPSSEMMAVEVRGVSGPETVQSDLTGLGVDSLMGPAVRGSSFRWLMQGSLRSTKIALRPLVQKWRDSGATVRLDVDPIDL